MYLYKRLLPYIMICALFSILLFASCAKKDKPTDPSNSIPSAPTNLLAEIISDTEIKLTWQDNSNNEKGIIIERRINMTESWSEIQDLNANYTYHNDTGLISIGLYYYRVMAYNDYGSSNYSNVICVKNYSVPQLILIPNGEFQMGDNYNEGYSDDTPVHNVYLDDYYIGQYEISNNQYCSFLNGMKSVVEVKPTYIFYLYYNKPVNLIEFSSSKIFWNGNHFYIEANYDNHPVIGLNFKAVIVYCNWLSEREGLDKAYDSDFKLDVLKNGYRLPTEAEWEKAARGGLVNKRYPWGDSIDSSKANYGLNNSGTTEVGIYPANNYGLYDMAGNASEWCNDWYDSSYYNVSPYNNPIGPSSGVYKVMRGGTWYNIIDLLKCSARLDYDLTSSSSGSGFRIVRNK